MSVGPAMCRLLRKLLAAPPCVSTQVNMPEMCLPIRVYLRTVCKSYVMVSDDKGIKKNVAGCALMASFSVMKKDGVMKMGAIGGDIKQVKVVSEIQICFLSFCGAWILQTHEIMAIR